MKNTNTLILGLGNPILSDDGVGLVIAELIRKRMRDVHVLSSPMSGIGLLDLIVGYEDLFLIDALLAEGVNPGELRVLGPGDPGLQYFSLHGFSLLELLKVGKELDLQVPQLRSVYGIAIRPDPPFGKDLSAELKQEIETLAERIFRDILLHFRLSEPFGSRLLDSQARSR